MNQYLIKSFTAGGAIGANLIVRFSADNAVVVAGAATELLLGVTTEIAADSGERVDVVLSGIVMVKAGGSITRGALVTSDASGQAVAAAPSAGANVRVLGVAMLGAASGDLVPVLLSQSMMQGA